VAVILAVGEWPLEAEWKLMATAEEEMMLLSNDGRRILYDLRFNGVAFGLGGICRRRIRFAAYSGRRADDGVTSCVTIASGII
jgi:hypothetical protein